MTDEEQIEYLIEEIEDSRRAGKTIAQAIDKLKRNPYFSPPAHLLDQAEARFLERAGEIMSTPDPALLHEREQDTGTWYLGPRENDTFWPPYRAQLAEALGEEAVEVIDRATSKTLQLMRPPGEDFRTRGLVLGYVQSGKTTNFISLIAKAADAGYRVFIILSGITDNLRSQTQERVDAFIDATGNQHWEKLTTLDRDFDGLGAGIASQIVNANTRLIAVVKKNPARLQRLEDWLRAASPQVLDRCPILLIDDEADQASIDVGTKGRTSTINKLMRQVLDLPKAAYVAYTATPFANLLIDPSNETDLYPRHFVVTLPKPDEYFGSERIFGTAEALDDPEDPGGELDVIRQIPEYEAGLVRPPRPAAAIAEWEPEIPEQLAQALKWFFLATAARRTRGKGNPHSTMLIHTSMLADAHLQLQEAASKWRDSFQSELEQGNPDIWSDLESFWASERPRSNPSIPESFDQIRAMILPVIRKTRIISDNYRSTERLTYSAAEPATTIVIGGNTLSRGLTLEGLTSSYFVRAASAYDTLLQMGRWFGYRKHYEDLVRIWLPLELQTWFRDLSLVESEIRREILRYEAERATPLELGVKIRTHPAMTITAAAKMRNAVRAQVTYSGARVQTILFHSDDKDWLARNIRATKELVSSAQLDEEDATQVIFPSGRRGFTNVSVAHVRKFLDVYAFAEEATRVRADLLKKYISNENAAQGLLRWNIVFIEGKPGTGETIDLGLDSPSTAINRSKLKAQGSALANLKSIASTADRIADLPMTPEEARRHLESIRATSPDLHRKDTEAALLRLRAASLGSTGLLCIYPIDRNSKPRAQQKPGENPREALDAVETVIGVGIFFPEAINPVSTVPYMTVDLSGAAYEDPVDEDNDLDAADREDEQRIPEERQ